MLSHEEESSDLAAKANSTSWLTGDVFVYAVGEGEVCSENSACFGKTGISG